MEKNEATKDSISVFMRQWVVLTSFYSLNAMQIFRDFVIDLA